MVNAPAGAYSAATATGSVVVLLSTGGAVAASSLDDGLPFAVVVPFGEPCFFAAAGAPSLAGAGAGGGGGGFMCGGRLCFSFRSI